MKTLYPFEKIKTCFLNHLHYTCQASHTVPSFKEKLIRKVLSPAFPFWLFSSFSFHSFADGGSFSADSSRIRLYSKRVQQEDLLSMLMGPRDLDSRNTFFCPTLTRAMEAISNPNFASLQLTRWILKLLISFICKHILLCTVHTEGIQECVMYDTFDISGLLKDFQYQIDKTLNTNISCCVWAAVTL